MASTPDLNTDPIPYNMMKEKAEMNDTQDWISTSPSSIAKWISCEILSI